MNKPNNRTIRLTVAGVSFLALVVIGYPLVDETYRLREDHRSLAKLEDEFESIQSRSMRLTRIEEKLGQKKEGLTNASVTQYEIPNVRDQIIGTVRDCEARLRGLDIHDGQTRRWGIEDDDPRSRRLPDLGMESEFELQTHALTLVADGTLDSLLEITRKIIQNHWLMTVDSYELKPIGEDANTISMELRLTFYGLLRSELPAEETIARKQGMQPTAR